MERSSTFDQVILDIDSDFEINRISNFIEKYLLKYKKEGIIVGLSGGIDSAVTASICVNTVGAENVYGLILPEKDSNPLSEIYAKKEADRLGIQYEILDITYVLSSFGTYEKRDCIIQSLFPNYNDSYKVKISLPSDLLDKDSYNIFKLTIENDRGDCSSARLSKNDLQGIVAATDTKQRTRMMHLYYHAEKKNYIVCGTTNKTEYIQGFFVKYGDGGVDIEPLMHLYKSQVYQLGKRLNIIEEIINRKPSPDTFSYEVSDEEFYFRMPFNKLDLLLYAWEHNTPINSIIDAMHLTEIQINRAFRDFSSKHRKTEYQRDITPSLL